MSPTQGGNGGHGEGTAREQGGQGASTQGGHGREQGGQGAYTGRARRGSSRRGIAAAAAGAYLPHNAARARPTAASALARHGWGLSRADEAREAV